MLLCATALPASAAFGGLMKLGYPSRTVTLSREDESGQHNITINRAMRLKIDLDIQASDDVPYALAIICYNTAKELVFGGYINSEQLDPETGTSKNGLDLSYSGVTDTLPAGTYYWLVAVVEQQWEDTPDLTISHSLLLTEADAHDADGTPPEDTLGFVDVSYGDWYYDAVEHAVTKGLFRGTSDSSFSPNQALTRGMFVTILGRYAGVEEGTLSEDTGYNDVDASDYYAVHIKWATGQEIVSGTGGESFSPDAALSRQDMVTMLYNYVRASGGDLRSAMGRFSYFSDTDQVDSYAAEPMLWAIQHGLINGTDQNYLSPMETATRAQVAQMIYNAGILLEGDINTAIVPPPPPVSLGTYICYTDANGAEYAPERRPRLTIKMDKTFELSLDFDGEIGFAFGTWASSTDASGHAVLSLSVPLPPGETQAPDFVYSFQIDADGNLVKIGDVEDGVPIGAVFVLQ